MAVRQRKHTGPFVPALGLYDFLPVYVYRGSDGHRHLFVAWPIIVALIVGFFVGRSGV